MPPKARLSLGGADFDHANRGTISGLRVNFGSPVEPPPPLPRLPDRVPEWGGTIRAGKPGYFVIGWSLSNSSTVKNWVRPG